MMRSFSDSKGESWPINLSGAAMKRIRDQAGIDFVNGVHDGNIWDKVLGDPLQLVDVLAAACQPTMTSRGISIDEFNDRLSGAVCHEAAAVLASEITDFFLGWSPAVGKLLQKSYEAHRRYHIRANEMVEKRLSSFQIDKAVEKANEIVEQEVDRLLAEIEDKTARPTTGN